LDEKQNTAHQRKIQPVKPIPHYVFAGLDNYNIRPQTTVRRRKTNQERCEMMKKVIDACGIDEVQFFGKQRPQKVVDARCLFAVFALMKGDGYTTAARFMKIDHSSVFHYKKRHDNRLFTKDSKYSKLFHTLEAIV
jgi:hypothetical protein